MSTQTPNLNLDLREGTDIFNPLSTNSNFETLDSVITEIRKKGGVPTYTTTASANLLKLSENPVPNETLFKFVAAGDANTWSFQETVNNIVSLDGKQKTVKAGEMYVAWVNSANAMVVIAWPDVVNAQTFDGKGPAEWASKAQLDAVNQTAANATTTAQAAATVANNALTEAQKGITLDTLWDIADSTVNPGAMPAGNYQFNKNASEYKVLIFTMLPVVGSGATNDTCILAKSASGNWPTAFPMCPSFQQDESTPLAYGRKILSVNNNSFQVSNGYRWVGTQFPSSADQSDAYMSILRVQGIK